MHLSNPRRASNPTVGQKNLADGSIMSASCGTCNVKRASPATPGLIGAAGEGLSANSPTPTISLDKPSFLACLFS